MDELRALLHALADRVASRLDAPPSSAPAPSASPQPDAAHWSAIGGALEALARGDLAAAQFSAGLASTPEGSWVAAATARVRGLVEAARSAVGRSDQALSELRSAAERASDAAGRERLALDRAAEQLRQLQPRTSEIAAALDEAREMSERAALLALNAGIEGLRLGGDASRALGALGDELRKLSQRAASGAREAAIGMRASATQLGALAQEIDHARHAARSMADEAARAIRVAEGLGGAEQALVEAAAGFRTLDDETETLVGQLISAADVVERDVADARARLGSADPAAAEALRRALERLARAAGGSLDGR